MPNNQTAEARRSRRVRDRVGLVLLVLVMLVVVLLSPLLLLAGLFRLAQVLALRIAFLIAWAPRGRRVLFVYSDSPVWRDYIRERVLPRLPTSAVILNWSERSTWPRTSLAVWAFRHYAGMSEFNPFGLVVPPFGRARLYRFWRPFREFKHGRPEALAALEKRFFEDVAAV